MQRISMEMELFEAAKTGNLNELQAVVESANGEGQEEENILNSVDFNERTILHVAAMYNQVHIIRWILSDGGGRALGFTKVLAIDTCGSTALHCASVYGESGCCEAIVEGCSEEEREKMLNSLTENGRSALLIAARNDREEVIRWILSDGGGRALGFTKVLAIDTYGSTALHHAAAQGYLGCCKAIVEGCKVENGEREEMLRAVANRGTVLHVAIENGWENIVRWLFSNEEGGGRSLGFTPKDVGVRNDEGQTALHCAVEKGDMTCICLIARECIEEKEELKRMLNAAESKGCTLLHTAVHNGHSHIIRWLLSNKKGEGRSLGFSSETITFLNTESKSSLHKAADCGSSTCIETLLSGCTAEERIKLFLAVDMRGWTALHFAARARKMGVIQEVLRWEEAKMIVDARDNRGMTALHRIACNGGLDEESCKEWKVFMSTARPVEVAVRALLGLSSQPATAAVAFVDVNARLEIPEGIRAAAAAAAATTTTTTTTTATATREEKEKKRAGLKKKTTKAAKRSRI